MNLSFHTADNSRLNIAQENSIVESARDLVADGINKEEIIHRLERFMISTQTGNRTFPIIKKYINELKR